MSEYMTESEARNIELAQNKTLINEWKSHDAPKSHDSPMREENGAAKLSMGVVKFRYSSGKVFKNGGFRL